MLDDMRVNDIELTAADIGALENADEVAHLFAQLGYDVDARTPIADIATLGLDTDDLRQHILRLELLAVDPVDEDIKVYLFEVRSVTAKLRNDIARRFRERPENALLVLTSDYETLDFVLLERVVTKSKSRGKPLQQVIRPIPLNIHRRNPEPVKLRVLKRFSFTEEDSAYQWEKLRSAYMLAEWSEEYFNNRALFSDYYLKQRLTDARLTPEWNEDVRPAGREAYKYIITARKNFSRQPEAVIRRGLYEPLFTLLGFDFVVNKASDSAADEADYQLFRKGDRSQPIAVALTYVWNRNLDDVDTTREPEDGTPDEIPGAMVVSVLEKTQVPWVIVTNGKLWRLYSSTASNKATNYYEVDLEEAIAANDQITALKYWWLLFRQQAFTGFLDTLLSESNKYAAHLRERLKDDVFLRIFPQFAKGFITHMRAQGMKEGEINLDLVFSGTMTFLYRMMFILYAESLDLLPVSEERGYGEYSLYALKRELAKVGGEAETDAPDKLKKHYTTKSTAIYERLKALFGMIDEGSAEQNMPTYNGGLFSPETDSGRFLDQYAIPDQFLMLGLDRLTRDEDDKTKKLVFIDFKSLGVRQLGSIYEGLLEFKLKIAAEALAVEKDGKREVYIPLKKAKKKEAVVAIAKGEVYLENDKQERKATGSYYTPDYIVKYIVQHTVGPVLERKLNECAPRLRQAQADYRAYVKLVEARRKSSGKEESPTTFWNSAEMQQLVDDCLNVRVLDPAMGSGHFLVEVVDFVSNKLIDFLNGWSENPVWAALDRIREDIQADMERQHVTIDADKLTRVALLKRAVLKRCVYGVDLNGMAVELAKVSLWLDAFTLGAPLSFLDHHLKWGNSLIGARVSEVQKALAGQQTLFSSNKFAGVMLATDLMQQVSYLSDNTVAQVQASQTAYRDASDQLAPYKRVLDVYTSRWFGNTPAAGKRGASAFDPTIEFLKRDDTQAWLEDPRKPENRLPPDDYMKAGLVAKTALHAAESKHFFHWELEFPEVFFAPSTPGGQDVKLREDGGFDAVVGNPPYIRIQTLGASDSNYFSEFTSATENYDIYALFVERGLKLLNPKAKQGYILPHKFFEANYGLGLRTVLTTGKNLDEIIHFGHQQVFDGASTYTCLLILSSEPRSEFSFIQVNDLTEFNRSFQGISKTIAVDSISPQKWQFVSGDDARVFALLEATALTLEGVTSRIFQGLKTSADGIYIVDELERQASKVRVYSKHRNAEYWLEPDLLRPLVKGGDSHAYELSATRRLILFPYISHNGAVSLVPEADFKRCYPLTWQYLLDNKSYLENRENGKMKGAKWYEFGRNQALDVIPLPKLFTPDIAIRPAFSYDDTGEFFFTGGTAGGYGILVKNPLSPYYVLTLLNSSVSDWYIRKTSTTMRGGYFNYEARFIRAIPIRTIDFTTLADERTRRTQAMIEHYNANRPDLVLHEVQEVVPSKTDIVHDLLTHLAQRMIDLNKQKQAEVKRFLGWLEGKLKIIPKNGVGGIDSLTGKTDLQNYLGDYEKGQPPIAWQDFYYRLHQNRNRFGVALANVEAEVRREYDKSLAVLLPIKRDLARTDTLIDKIVYQLYGLTPAEIELIERPQYEQALTDAKTEALKDETLTDDEAKLDKIAESILPAAQRFFERINPADVETALDGEIPNWRTLPPDAPTFLLTGDYNLRSLPDQMDFSSSVIPYTKAIEVVLHKRIFEPFRSAGYTENDCKNEYLQKFMQGGKPLTLGSAMIILSSSKETALRGFMNPMVRDIGTLATALNDPTMRDVRNKAAHDEVLSRSEAQQTRTWAIRILGMV